MRAATAAAALLVFLSLAAPAVAAQMAASNAPASAGSHVSGAAGSHVRAVDSVVTASVGRDAFDRGSGAAPAGLDRPDPKTVIAINLTRNGDARWRISSRFVVETDNESAAFDQLAADVRSGDASVGSSPASFRRIAAAVENETGRSMAIRNPRWTTSVHNGTGVISLRFTWTNFAETGGDHLSLGDAFELSNGTWFPRLEAGQRLEIRPPPNYIPVNTPIRVNNGALVWDGPRDFDSGYLSASFRPPIDRTTETTTPGTTTSPGTTVTTTRPGTTGGTTTAPPKGGSSFLFWIGLFVLVASVGAGGYFLASQHRPDDDDGTAAATSDEGAGDAGAADSATASGGESGAAAAGGSGAAAAGGSGAAAAVDESTTASDATADASVPGGGSAAADSGDSAAATDDAGEEDVDPELLSDEERVERLLRRNGGRMKQANIVKETGWSNAKVSQLLSGMDENERINKLRIGRENLITLPDEDVTDF